MIQKVLIYLVLIALAVFYVFPIYTLVNTSLKTDEDLKYGPVAPAHDLYFGAYAKALNLIKKPLVNSVIITVFATLVSSFLGSMSGYIFSKFRFKGDRAIFLILVLGFYIAPQSILIPLVIFMGKTGLFNTYAGLVLTHVAYGVPITTLLFRNYYEGIPQELVDSSRVDGCGTVKTFTRIFLPLSLPGFAVVGIFQFTNIWNEFLFGLTLTRGVTSQPVTVAVANLKGTTVAAWNMICAGASITAIPVVLIYIFLLKIIIKGLLMGSVKG
ncbi:MAG: carbohydrate ABC transporter permease [Spirochaetales bacterium]|nr:carbohydrate ABC transporter permease [Spirochaetales bacterium]